MHLKTLTLSNSIESEKVMSVEESIKKKYTELCQALGDMSLKKKKTDAQVEELENQISSLLTYAPELIAVEKAEADERAKNAERNCPNCSCNAGPNSN